MGSIRWTSTRIALAACGRARKAVTMPRDKPVHGRAKPAQRRQACDPAEPGQFRQDGQQSQPRFKSSKPLSFGGAYMHFTVKLGSREGGLRRHCRVAVVQKPQPSTGIVRLDLRLAPPAEGTGAIQENIVLCGLRHRARPEYTSIMTLRGAVERMFELRPLRWAVRLKT
jgi:hypothetical protein